MPIPFLLEAAAVLATFVHPNHIVYLCSWGLTCRLPATPSSLGITPINTALRQQTTVSVD
ncbi:hypothetical protein FLM05_01345 [Vibrio cholerae]|uniref:Uncharacterized protein n=1 Tax=Vibrio cholerae TaxID=666 RepID=A0A543YEZ7_VIBCL|nr:hypothetical protein FLM08_03340 [Vibrio cholerae]TQO91811.1 hypothetical protein FLM05_01345 [Vibrio cholerae]TQP04575.1 hypothetical protein FLM07_04425 [Vibrio cholerae]TQP16633.1 hypothetical protein FLM02_04130 [Vibrio cholerae]TQP25928.1 hypothetical protein FLM04_01690 [Vibrio cholerae]